MKKYLFLVVERQVYDSRVCGLGFAYIVRTFDQQNQKSPTFTYPLGGSHKETHYSCFSE